MKTIGYYTDPRLAESKVQTLRTAFDDDLSWLDNSYPLVMIGVVDDVTIPLVYQSGADSYDLRPNDDVGSYCFFESYGYRPGDDQDMGVYSLAVVFWLDLTKVDTSRTQDYTWNLISDVLRVMDDNGCYNISVDTDDIFGRYTFDLDKQQLMRRFSGFKIVFDMYGLNTYCTLADGYRADTTYITTDSAVYTADYAL